MEIGTAAKGETEREVAARQEKTSRRSEAKAKESKAMAAKEATEVRIREQSSRRDEAKAKKEPRQGPLRRQQQESGSNPQGEMR